MEIELGIKITRTRDDITSLSDLRISKDPNDPLFVSRETNTMFILIAHLRDYREDNIDIKISEDGSRMAITGVKPVEEMVLKRWIMWRKDLKLRTFKKVFQVPEGVILDKIKAKFKEEDSILTITMPKLAKGIVGAAIEEVKEEEVEVCSPQETSNNVIPPEPESSTELEFKEAEEVVETEPEIAETIAEAAPEEEPDHGAAENVTIKEPANDIGEVSDGDRRESDVTEQMDEETSKETQEGEDQIEVEERSPERAEEPPASIALEPKEVQTERETQEPRTEIAAAPVEEPQTEDIQELKEETLEAETKVEPELVEEQHITPEKRQVESNLEEEVEKQEASLGVEEPIKPEPDQEEQGEKKEQVQEQETHQVSNEIEESVDEMRSPDEEERNEIVNPELEKQIDSNQGEIQKKKRQKKPKLCPPLVFAGSAILVSLIVFVISFIRSKKR